MTHKIGEILNIESYNGEFYVYGHITDVKQIIYCENSYGYPEIDLIESIKQDGSIVKTTYLWQRIIPEQPDSGYRWRIHDAKPHSRGAMPVTLVEMK